MNLIGVTYNLIAENRYQLARILLDFGTETLKTRSREDLRLACVVNRAQTYKWTGDEEKCRKILDGEDWTAANLKFRLAYAVLTDDFTEANRIVTQIQKGDEDLNKHAYKEWPLFRELRKSAEFAALFQEIFGEPLNKIVVQDKEVDSLTPGKSIDSQQVN